MGGNHLSPKSQIKAVPWPLKRKLLQEQAKRSSPQEPRANQGEVGESWLPPWTRKFACPARQNRLVRDQVSSIEVQDLLLVVYLEL